MRKVNVKMKNYTSSQIELSSKLSTELPKLSETAKPANYAEHEQVKVCGTCRGTLLLFRGYIWVQDFCRAVDCLCSFRKSERSEYEIVLTRRAVEALRVIAKLANSKVYCYKEKCWVRLLESACVFYTDKENRG